MENLKKISRNEMKTINGGIASTFPCYCNGKYLGQYSSVSSCVGACNLETA